MKDNAVNIKDNIEDIFLDICQKKIMTPTMPLKLIIQCDKKILMVGYRTRRDLNIVVNQMKKREAKQRSMYANFLWEKSTFKSR